MSKTNHPTNDPSRCNNSSNPPPPERYAVCRGDGLRFAPDEPGVEAYVLDDEVRGLTARGIVTLLEPGADHAHVDRYVREFAQEHLGAVSTPIPFRIPGTPLVGHCYDAKVFTAIVRGVLKRAAAGTLRKNHRRVAARCQVIAAALLDAAIEDLVDSVTGYDRVRAARDTQTRVMRYVREERSEWVGRFPREVFDGYAQLEGTKHDPQHRPIRWGKYNLDFVYRPAFGEEVVEALKALSPSPHHRDNLHQYLNGKGERALDRQLTLVLTLLSVSRDMPHFRRQLRRICYGVPEQLAFEDRAS